MHVDPFATRCTFLVLLFALHDTRVCHAEPKPPGSSNDSVESEVQSAELEVTIRESGLRPPISQRDPTAASTVISGGALRTPGKSTADVLGMAPGVMLSRTGAGADIATASIRGSTGAQTPVLLAGVELSDGVTGVSDLSLIPLWMIDRVEVYRGNAPDFAGLVGVGGVVVFEPRLPKKTGFGSGLGFGSYGETIGSIAGTVRSPHSASIVGFHHSRARNNYSYIDDMGTRFDVGDDRERTRHNADFAANDAWVVSRFDTGSGADLTIIANVFSREQGVTGLSAIPASYTRSSVQRYLGAVSARTPCFKQNNGEASDRCLLTLSTYTIVSNSRIDDPFREFSLPSTGITNKSHRLTEQGRLQYRFGDHVEFSVSASQSVEHLAVLSDDSPGQHASRYTSRGSVAATIGVLPDVSIHAIAGVECRTTEGHQSGAICGMLEPYGRLGARWSAAPWVVFQGNVGRYTRAPTLGELHGVSATILGNSSLSAEEGVSVDAGVRFFSSHDRPKHPSGYAEVFAFSRWVDDLITFRRATFGSVRPFNVGSARIVGLEFSAGAEWFDHFSNEASLTLLDPRDTTTGRRLSNDVLPFRSRLVLVDRFEVFSAIAANAIRIDRVGFGVLVQHRASRFADPAGLIVIAPHTVVDLELSTRLLDRVATLQFAARDVFNSTQYDTLGYPLPTRSYHVNVEAWY